MSGAITNTSPLLYLGQIGALDLPAPPGMWLSPDIRRRVLSLAGEDDAG